MVPRFLATILANSKVSSEPPAIMPDSAYDPKITEFYFKGQKCQILELDFDEHLSFEHVHRDRDHDYAEIFV